MDENKVQVSLKLSHLCRLVIAPKNNNWVQYMPVSVL